MIITFEGLDTSGKSTQITLLHKYLDKKYINCKIFSDPGKLGISSSIREILLDKKNTISPMVELFLYQTARVSLTENDIIPSLVSNNYVILDRYIDSTVAYQGYGRGIDIDTINTLNALSTMNVVINKTFYLRLTIDEFLKRIHNKKKDRIESNDESFFQRVIEGYDTIAKSSNRYVTIDATLTREEIHHIITENI